MWSSVVTASFPSAPRPHPLANPIRGWVGECSQVNAYSKYFGTTHPFWAFSPPWDRGSRDPQHGSGGGAGTCQSAR